MGFPGSANERMMSFKIREIFCRWSKMYATHVYVNYRFPVFGIKLFCLIIPILLYYSTITYSTVVGH